MENEMPRTVAGRQRHPGWIVGGHRAARRIELPDQDAVQGQIGRQHESARGIGLDHMCMNLVVSADSEASRRRARCMRRAERTLVVFDVGCGTQFAVRKNRQDRHRAAGVGGDEHEFARRVHAQMCRTRALRTDGIEQRQMSARAIDRIGAGRTVGRLVGAVEMCPSRIECQPRRVRRIWNDLALGERAGFRIHLKQVDPLSISVAPFRALRRTVTAHVGENLAAWLPGQRRGAGDRAGNQCAPCNHLPPGVPPSSASPCFRRTSANDIRLSFSLLMLIRMSASSSEIRTLGMNCSVGVRFPMRVIRPHYTGWLRTRFAYFCPLAPPMGIPSRTSSLPRRTTLSPAASAPLTSIKSPSAAPFFTSTHSARPFRLRITKVRSVVVTTLVLGANSAGCSRRTGHLTLGYMPGASVPSRLRTSNSTGMVRVFGSSAWAMRATVPVYARSGYAGTRNGMLAPRTVPPTSSSGTGTTSRSREICCTTSSTGSAPGPTNAPGCTKRSVTTPSNGAVIFK